ncbi:MAG: pitrilysin family protein [Halanaerobiales bacterium]
MIYKNFDEIGEEYYEEELGSGLKVVLIPREKFNKKHAILSVDAGSVDLKLKDENERIHQYPKGIAHFMEHILFENREGSIINKFSQIGSNVNAYTGFNNTNYYFNTTNDFFRSLKYLFDFVLNPHFDQKRIEHEKNVINQEINMYQDSPNWQSFYQLLQSLYYKYPIKFNIAGSPKSIKDINQKLLMDFFDKYYDLSNMRLIVIGNIAYKELFGWLTNKFKQRKNQKKHFDKVYPEEPKGIKLKEKDIAMSISRPIISLGYKENRCFKSNKKIIEQDMITNMILEMIFGKSNDYYHKLYNKNLIDENFSFNYMREKNTGFAKIYAETSFIDETIGGIIEILNSWENEMSAKDFEVVKNKYIGRYYRSLNSFETLSSQIIKYLNLGHNYLDIIKIIKKITLNDLVNQYHNLFKDQQGVKIIIRKISK